ncbi:MAG: PAS domain-containing protein [Treponema sp.]|jgi:predicted transcriptional regulator YheO|nr:PAS domain-containing protein [Treponema sp.]
MMTELSLTDTERQLLDSYKTSLEGLGAYLGEAFEFVLHDLSDLEHSIIKIINGHHSGRKEGAPITDLALSMLGRINANNAGPYINYISKSKHGRPVKSSTIAIFGESKRVIGMICINLYLDSPLLSLLEGFTTLDRPVEFVSENFINDSEELIARSLQKVKHDVDADSSIPVSHKNREIISILYHQGIFKLKSAVRMVSRDLNLSKNTVYLHLRSLDE